MPAEPSFESGPQPATLAEIDASCRLPLFVMFVSAAVWLVIGSAFALISTLTFHKPSLFANSPWLSYGRAYPAFFNSLLYGFCVQAGLGVALWIIARIGRVRLKHRWVPTIGVKLWNLGVTVGVIAILAGDSTGFQHAEIPKYAALIMFLGYLLIGIWIVLTFHQRRERPLFVAQWFLLAALFWFPWIYSSAYLLLVTFPVRGVAQAVIAWWFSNNLIAVWLGLVGLGAAFYLVAKLTSGELYSRYLALLTFWGLILCASWGAIPVSAPVPAWMPALSTVSTVFIALPVVTVALNIFGTLRNQREKVKANLPLQFVFLGVIGFLVAGLMNVVSVLPSVSPVTNFTWFSAAKAYAQCFGFFTLVMFGVIYHIVPQLARLELSSRLVLAHLWLAGTGVLFLVLALAIGGLVQGFRLQDASIAFTNVSKGTLTFLRISTIGDLLIALGNAVFLVNVAGVVTRFCRTHAVAAYDVATADLFKPAEAKS